MTSTPKTTTDAPYTVRVVNDGRRIWYAPAKEGEEGLYRLPTRARAEADVALRNDPSTCLICMDGCSCSGPDAGCEHLWCWGGRRLTEVCPGADAVRAAVRV